MKLLFTNQTSNDSSASAAVTSTGTRKLAVHVFGTFDGATITVPLSTNGISDGVVLTQLSFTTANMILIDVPDEITIWAELSGAGAGTNISVFLAGLGE